ncbi:MAG: four helix bundle protein [Planctomycetes bacterium]|nr:four helix bundle protein [Planctomycetota bacterium]
MRFEDLRVWQRARGFAGDVQKLGRGMRGDAGLGDQMRRAAISIVSNIAEGCERGSDADFRRFLIMARGSCSEVRAQLYIALDGGYVDVVRFSSLQSEAEQMSAMLNAFIVKLCSGAGAPTA